MAQQPKLICVTGPDGAGKTTQIKRLAEGLVRRGKLKIAPVTIWDLLIDPASHHKVPFKSPTEMDTFLQVLHPVGRSMFLFSCFYEALELAKARKPDILLVNAYWYKYYATEVAYGADSATLLKLAEVFPEPEVTLYLRVSPEEAFQRKAALSGYETGFAEPRSREAFVAFQSRALPALDTEAERRGWVQLNGSESVQSLTDTILGKI